MERIIVGILIIIITASLVYVIYAVLKGLRGKGSYDRETLVKRLEIEQKRRMPAVEKELNVIPVEDAMAVSSNEEKRTLLLEQLKKDIDANYKAILPAGSDSDSESAHYVAAARMEVYRRKQAALVASKTEWEADGDNQEKLRNYLRELESYIDSSLLADKEAGVYKTEYCKRVEQKCSLCTAEEYSCCLAYLVDLKQYEKAEAFWKKIAPNDKNEKAYRTILQMYYDLRNEKMFFKYLEDLRKSKISLSAEGLKLVRYWMERRPY